MAAEYATVSGILDWLRRRRETAQGLAPGGGAPASGAPPPSPTPTPAAPVPEGALVSPASVAPPTAGYDPYDPTLPFPDSTTDTLARFYNDLKHIENEQHRLRQIVGNSARNAGDRYAAEQQLILENARHDGKMRDIAAEENRRADNARAEAAAKTAAEAKAEAERKTEEERTRQREREAATTPAEGQTRRVGVSWTGEYGPAQGTVEETYSKGSWSRVPNSFRPEAGFAPSGETPKGRLEQQTAELNLRVAQQKFDEATSPEAKERARLELDLARWNLEQARTAAQRATLPQIVQPGQGRVITFQDPNTGALTTQENPAYTAPLPQNAYAALEQETARVQAAARAERDRLYEQQRQGLLGPDQAKTQFDQWLAQQRQALTGLEAAAREQERQEQIQFEQAQRVEQQRVEGLERTRQQIGLEAGTLARRDLAEAIPAIRTPGFLQQYGGMGGYGRPAAAPSAEAAARLPAAPGITPDTFNIANWRAAVPDLDEYARQATARALSQISPIAAQTIGRPMPRFPSALDIPGLVARVPYAGPLAGLPSPTSGLTPTPGMEAVDLGPMGQPGLARTRYGPQGNVYYDWPIGG